MSPVVPGYPDIQDLAIIGNCRTAAILDRDGRVVWFCAPRFDSGSLFASLLDRRKGGEFRVAPTGSSEVSRRYVGPTPVLETTFHTQDGGVLRLTDLMPVVRDEDRDRRPWPQHLNYGHRTPLVTLLAHMAYGAILGGFYTLA